LLFVGPFGISAGDEVFILPGCDYPLLIRKRGNAHQVVGICSAYGMMDGEMIATFNAGEPALMEVKLA
jgi:hypothetical protein